MSYLTPLDAIKTLVEARDKGDLEAVVSCYEANATIVPQPGTVEHGTKAVREWLASFAALRPKLTVTSREIIEGGDIALHCSAWTMNGIDPTGKPFERKGRTADILRKQPNGSWLVALDNPWGTEILRTN